MQIIDAHIHADFDSQWLKRIGFHCGVEFSADGLKKEMEECGIVHCISMGLQSLDLGMDSTAPTPYETAPHLRLPAVTYTGGVNPFRADPSTIENTRTSIRNGSLRGLKVYLGYFPFPPNSPVYRPFYLIAEEYGVPVIFHTGGAESSDKRVNCAHPSGIDEIAVDYPGVNFLIAHLGNPWFMDAAQVVAKNKNVYADLSGFVAGADNYDLARNHQLPPLQEAVTFLGNTSRLLYGSDWPITPMKDYIEFIRTLFPDHHDQEKVFYKNAVRLFNLELS